MIDHSFFIERVFVHKDLKRLSHNLITKYADIRFIIFGCIIFLKVSMNIDDVI